MKNKVITIVCAILIILAIICFGYIFLNSSKKEEKPSDDDVTTAVDNPQPEDPIKREERTQNIIVTSRIGVKLKEIIKYSDIYSNRIIDELDKNGLSDEAKILIAFDKIFKKEEYRDFMQYSEEEYHTYITSQNMNKVIQDLFSDSNIKNTSIEGTIEYNVDKDYYYHLPIGYETGSMGYTVEVPYKITEYSDRIEMLAYRLYITKTVKMEDIVSTVDTKIYYDKLKSIMALNIVDENEINESNQVEYLRQKIESKEIDNSVLESVQYTFKIDNETYKLDSFKQL